MTTNLTPPITDGPTPAGPKGDRGVNVRGIWAAGLYAKDDIVTRFNSVWIAEYNTTVAPDFNLDGQSNSPDWLLLVDGRGTQLAGDIVALVTGVYRQMLSRDLGAFANDAAAVAFAAAQSPALTISVGTIYWNTTSSKTRICTSTTSGITWADRT